MRNKNFWLAVTTLVGYTIGAGILGIPYVVAKVGYLPGLAMLILIGLASMLINLMIAEIMLRTRYRHQLVGLIGKYLGKRFKMFESLAMIVGSYGAITAYVTGEGQIIAALFGKPNHQTLYSFIFLAIGITVLIFGLKLIKLVSFGLVLFLILVALVIAGICAQAINLDNLTQINLAYIFVPYGVLLFAFGGTGSIFSVKEILTQDRKMMRRAIITGGVIVISVYVLFATMVVGVTGAQTSEIATIGLGDKLGNGILLASNLFALISMASCFFTVSMGLNQVFRYDYRFPMWLAWLAVLIAPVLIFLFVSHDFIKIISFFGSLTFGISGSLIVWSFWKAKKHGDQAPEFSLPKFRVLGWGLIAMFVMGLIYTVVK